MKNIWDAQVVRDELKRLRVKPDKARGQNFLVNDRMAQTIVDAAELSAGDMVLEIGPGLGSLTRLLLDQGVRVVAIEVEEAFCRFLEGELKFERGVNLFRADALEKTIPELFPSGERVRVISNVPYSISSELVLWILDQYEHISEATLLLQKEFAERMAATPGSRTYGILTVHRAYVANAWIGGYVPGSAFEPPPDVESAILRLTLDATPRVVVSDRELLRTVVRASFSSRRKTISNSLGNAPLGRELGKELLRVCFETASINPQARAETLSVEDFGRLTQAIVQHRTLSSEVDPESK